VVTYVTLLASQKIFKSLGGVFPAACGVDKIHYMSDTPLLAAGSFIIWKTIWSYLETSRRKLQIFLAMSHNID